MTIDFVSQSQCGVCRCLFTRHAKRRWRGTRSQSGGDPDAVSIQTVQCKIKSRTETPARRRQEAVSTRTSASLEWFCGICVSCTRKCLAPEFTFTFLFAVRAVPTATLQQECTRATLPIVTCARSFLRLRDGPKFARHTKSIQFISAAARLPC